MHAKVLYAIESTTTFSVTVSNDIAGSLRKALLGI